ncbi:RND family transporter [Pseudonocardiaceae bacterium YIM PH 21723]|nr:RND family transporter [Pseudonocardiaceae bacterium YIM PH 21723]
MLLAAGLNLGIPQLEKVIEHSGEPMVPAYAPSVNTLAEMDKQFGGQGSRGVLFLIMANEQGLTEADRKWYGDISERLRKTKGVTSVQDVISQPEFATGLASQDGKALYALISVGPDVGSAASIQSVRDIRTEVAKSKPADVEAYVTGPSATISDMQVVVDKSLIIITVVSVGVIALILLLIFRSILTAGVVLMTIGIALATARAVTAFCGLNVFSLSPFTASFMTAVVLGAGTDYSVFLIGRMRELLGDGLKPLDAAIEATKQISGVVAGSALTVAITTGFMALTEIGMFWTTGPAIALSILVTLAVSITLSPAAMAIIGSWGLVRPSTPTAAGGRWARIADLVVRRPVPVLLAGLLLLVSIGAFYPKMRLNYDQSVMQPGYTDSNKGLALVGKHFDLSAMNPDFVMIQSDHDLRNPKDLAAIERVSGQVATVPGVSYVRSVTRPLGSTIQEASLGYQAGELGKRLDEAKDRVSEGVEATGRLQDGGRRLAGGAGQLADGAGQLSAGAQQAIAGADRLLQGLNEEHAGLGQAVDGTGRLNDGAQQLKAGASQLADGLEAGLGQVRLAVDGLGLAYNALAADPVCTLDPVCNAARAGIRQIWIGERDQLLPGMQQAAAGARRIADGNGQLADGTTELKAGLIKAKDGIVQLSDGQRLFKTKMGEMANGADRLAGGAGLLKGGANQIADGTGQFTGSIKELQDGLAKAADFLLTTGKEARDPKIGGFYLPADALADPRILLAKGFFLSEDGKSARLIVAGSHPVGSRPAMETATATMVATKQALKDTPLEGATVNGTGMSHVNLDLRSLVNSDFARVATIGLIGVFLILMFLLRSLIAPIYLLGSVVLSYASTMGIGVLIWQDLLGLDVDWSIPPIAFILLVAVGADYNLLLMSRIKQEAPDGSRAGIARALSATGGVITAAGLIFAASMFALMAGDGLTLSQLGFMIGVGLLLDTFVVRTLIVPATAALLGRWNWWPASGGAEPARRQEDLALSGAQAS